MSWQSGKPPFSRAGRFLEAEGRCLERSVEDRGSRGISWQSGKPPFSRAERFLEAEGRCLGRSVEESWQSGGAVFFALGREFGTLPEWADWNLCLFDADEENARVWFGLGFNVLARRKPGAFGLHWPGKSG
ncbi:hypothetical protein [Kiritimatiella glycovorans]|uniref:hypothetical protein n=1 Tax=Kiritimatiella glycovorans TaxID=1307763 RepID=UPI0013648D97|nr:hypothetical protein [Kiritimatiella glycovorans]